MQMYYEVSGSGDPLVVLHGAYLNIGQMGEIIPLLAATHTVYALEFQGHDRTTDIDRPITYENLANDVAAFMDALDLAFFAGIWARWTSVRKLKDGETTDDLFGFLTCASNGDVGGVHPKAMPVILTELEEWLMWLTAPWSVAMSLKRPLADGLLQRGGVA